MRAESRSSHGSTTHRATHGIYSPNCVVDEGPSSARAIANLSAICKNHLPDNHQIEIVDLLEDPRRVLSDHVVATPTLIKLSPAPVRKIIGDLGEEAKVLLALGLQQRTT